MAPAILDKNRALHAPRGMILAHVHPHAERKEYVPELAVSGVSFTHFAGIGPSGPWKSIAHDGTFRALCRSSRCCPIRSSAGVGQPIVDPLADTRITRRPAQDWPSELKRTATRWPACRAEALRGAEQDRAGEAGIEQFAFHLLRVRRFPLRLDGQRAAGIGAESGVRRLQAGAGIDLAQTGGERIALVAEDSDADRPAELAAERGDVVLGRGENDLLAILAADHGDFVADGQVSAERTCRDRRRRPGRQSERGRSAHRPEPGFRPLSFAASGAWRLRLAPWPFRRSGGAFPAEAATARSDVECSPVRRAIPRFRARRALVPSATVSPSRTFTSRTRPGLAERTIVGGE